jgi:hypothetical protein
VSSPCSFVFYGDEFVAQLFGLARELHFEPFFPVGVSSLAASSPDGFVIFDLVFCHGVKDQCDLVRCRSGGGPGAQLGFHSAQIVAQGRRAMMEGKGCKAKEMTDAIFHCSYSSP